MREFDPYTIAVPHQRPAYTVAGQMTAEGARDLHCHHYIGNEWDEVALLAQTGPRHATRHPHQWVRIRSLILEQREAAGRLTSFAAIRRNHYYDSTTIAPLDSVVAVADTAEEALRLAAEFDQEPDERGLVELSHGQYAPDRGEVAEIVAVVPDADLWLAVELAGCEDAAIAAAAEWESERAAQGLLPLDPAEPTQGWLHANDDAFTDVAGLIRAVTGLELIGSDDGELYLVRTLA